MDNSFSQVEILTPQEHFNQPNVRTPPWYKSRRLLTFFICLMLSLSLSLSYVYSRPEVFRSYASLLTVAQTAIDEQSSDADIQHVAIQRQILSGQNVMEEILQQVDNKSLSIAQLRTMLTVNSIVETNLVELAATGYKPDLLVALVNSWVDVYLTLRAEEIRQTTGVTLDVLQQELTGLEEKILLKRGELAHFREVNNITSLSRENIFDNQALARFKGFNKSLNDATEEAIKSKARLDAVNNAIAQGKMVVPSEDKHNIRVLELSLQKLQKELAEFDRKYTRSYLALQPKLNVLPGQIATLKEEIEKKRNYGQSIVLTDAEQDAEAAQQALLEIEKQLEAHKQQANEFSSKFAENESLLTDLEGLEELQRVARERMVQIEAKQAEQFPQVKVIERAYLPQTAISPDYIRDAIIALVGSLVLSLFLVWMVEFLNRKNEQKPFASTPNVNGYNASVALTRPYQQKNMSLAQEQVQHLTQTKNHTLEHHSVRELDVNELKAMLDAGDNKAKQVISLLLTGLTLHEMSLLKNKDIDLQKDLINVSGESPRTLAINSSLKALFADIQPCPAWDNGQPVSEKSLASTLASTLTYAAVDAGLTEPQEITASSISAMYIRYLVEQGIRMSELEQLIGFVDSEELLYYSRFSPEKRGLSLAEINLVHPAMMS